MKTFFSCLFLISFTSRLIAQVPQGISYQSILRNNVGNLLVNKPLVMRFSFRDSIITGPIEYQETQAVSTSVLGMVTLTIGNGTATINSFTSINWALHTKFLEVEIDTNASNNYINLGTQQMMSVPYALYAASAGAITPANSGITEFSNISPSGMHYFAAVEYCRNLVENGHSDWRLPTSNEVENYIELHGWSIITSSIWTKTIFASDPMKRLIYGKNVFLNGTTEIFLYSENQSSTNPTQCVR